MNKTVISIMTVVIIILVILLSKYYQMKENKNNISKFNSSYEEYLDKEVTGTKIATIINKAIDDNEKIIQDNDEFVKIDVRITDLEDKIYDMNTLYNGGIADFVKYYSNILFKGTKIEYNSNGKVKYLLFEQIGS